MISLSATEENPQTEKSMTLRNTRPVQKEQQRSCDSGFEAGRSIARGSDGGGGVACDGDSALSTAAFPTIAASAAAAAAEESASVSASASASACASGV